MTETDIIRTRRSLAFAFFLIFLVGMGVQIILIERGIVVRGSESTVNPLDWLPRSVPTAIPTVPPSTTQPTHTDGCTSDPQLCRLQLNASLTWIQSRLTMQGVLTTDEYLVLAPEMNNEDCSVLIQSVTDRDMSDWLCFGSSGLYRWSKVTTPLPIAGQ